MEEWLDKLVIVQSIVDEEAFVGTLSALHKTGSFVVLTDFYRTYANTTSDVLRINKHGLGIIDLNGQSFSEKYKLIQLFNVSKLFPCSDKLISDLKNLNLE